MQLIGGIDEAGRGPCIGPMVICAIAFQTDLSDDYTQRGIQDSKQLTANQRHTFSKYLESTASQILYYDITAAEIDHDRAQGITLNELEYRGFETLIRQLDAEIVYIDSPDVIPSRLKARLAKSCLSTTQLIVEHKADENYLACGAASILAKVRRDNYILELQKQYGNIGSGYPSDPYTRKFLHDWISKHAAFPEFVRSTWETCRLILNEKNSTTLNEFSDMK